MNLKFISALKGTFFTFIICFVTYGSLFSQEIQVDPNIYSPQQLIEDILINSGCIQDIQITNSVTGNFGSQERSFGYFSNAGGSFPFEEGIVMSTGKLGNVPGPNETLSDDDAPDWGGDADLEEALQINNTINATLLEFDFIPAAENIRFRYIFASEEYQEGNANTCRYSDAFAFLIKPTGGTYTNIAVVPGSQTPVQVTTVHSGIPGACDPINEEYFEGWNDSSAPINFNGQTAILTAEAAVIPNQSYHIKLVIADESNFRYDSAVFLEGESFSISADLGEDRSFQNNNPLCENESYVLDATPSFASAVGYTWYNDGVLLASEISAQLTVTSPGIYSVEVDLGDGCIAPADVLIEYSGPVESQDTVLFQCEPSNTGFATYDLFDAEEAVIDGDATLQIDTFHTSIFDAENGLNPITDPSAYNNIQPTQVLHARVISTYGCVGIANITLRTTTATVGPYTLVECDDQENTGLATFDLSQIVQQINADMGNDIGVSFHATYSEAQDQNSELSLQYSNTIGGYQKIYVRVNRVTGCAGIGEVELYILPSPKFSSSNYLYCNGMDSQEMMIASGVIGGDENFEFLWSSGETTASIQVDGPGTYTVQATRTSEVNGEIYLCSSSQSIVVVGSEVAVLTYEITGAYGSQNLQVIAQGTGDYEYSLNNDFGPFQEAAIFENIEGGRHIVYVRDRNGCGVASMVVYIIDFPSYFTPNEDGYNDGWNLKGIDRDNLQITHTHIYDRFGKLLYRMVADSNAWNGTYNGQPLPASDYWFTTYFSDGGAYRGHFTLKR